MNDRPIDMIEQMLEETRALVASLERKSGLRRTYDDAPVHPLVVLRRRLGWTQYDVAERVGVSARTICRIEHCPGFVGQDTTRKSIAAIFGVPEIFLLGPADLRPLGAEGVRAPNGCRPIILSLAIQTRGLASERLEAHFGFEPVSPLSPTEQALFGMLAKARIVQMELENRLRPPAVLHPIARRRLECGISQASLAASVGISAPALNRIERKPGFATSPGLRERIALQLKTDIDALFAPPGFTRAILPRPWTARQSTGCRPYLNGLQKRGL